ncbi:MAG: pyrroline-5-carboxylate reductase [Pseudomarimonas sp.]
MRMPVSDYSSPSIATAMTTLSVQDSIVFVGGGNMARSLIGGLLERGAAASSILVSEPYPEARLALATRFGVHVGSDNAEAAANASTLVLAVKPQVMREVCASIAGSLPKNAVVVSIAAGITSQQLNEWLGGGRAVVRCMPNTPALLGAGATGMFANTHTSGAQWERARALMSAVGITVQIHDEALMDVVTALSGSGPAYVFLLAQAMQAGAEAQGLPSAAARVLTAQTLFGAARMLIEDSEDAAALRARVTSPGGTTQAAVATLQGGGFEALLASAIHAATERGRELARAAEGAA